MDHDLLDWLLDGTAITALVGTRVNWDERPQGEGLPSVTLTRIPGARPSYTLAGQRTDLTKYLIQADCWGATGLSAEQLRDAVQARLDAINTGDAGALEGCFLDTTGSSSVDELGGSGRVYRQRFDFAVWRRG